jgi:tRNA-splicing ligase RtcB
MQVLNEDGHKPIKMWTEGVGVEGEAQKQLLNVATLPFIFRHIAVMPDVHWGMGATVGSVIPTIGAIVPAAVGVDIGCGMVAQRLSLTASDLPDNLLAVRSAIEKAVPHGRSNNGQAGDIGAWGNPPEQAVQVWNDNLATGFSEIVERHPQIKTHNSLAHLCSLGTGNHFIEVCLDEQQSVWVMLHSGSRGVGNRIGSYFIQQAKKDMERWFIHLPDADLAYLPEGSDNFISYVKAVGWAQKFARLNRDLMMVRCIAAISTALGRSIGSAEIAINCHHNYVTKENHFGQNIWVTRKGAVSAKQGELGIIPGSMGVKSYIVSGKGNRESFTSCSHGAGRRMSRTEAKRRFTVDDHIKATEGVECRKDAGVVDETPMAYKDIDAVMEAQRDLVDVVHTLKQVVCVKG